MEDANQKKVRDYQEILSKIVKDIRYGSVVLVIQDGKVIQIDKTEKIRL